MKRDQVRPTATSFETRINNWMVNNIARAEGDGFVLELPHGGASLSSPLRGLLRAGIAKVLDEGELPAQGHSARSILGRGRSGMKGRPISPVHSRVDSKQGTEKDSDVNENSDKEVANELPPKQPPNKAPATAKSKSTAPQQSNEMASDMTFSNKKTRANAGMFSHAPMHPCLLTALIPFLFFCLHHHA